MCILMHKTIAFLAIYLRVGLLCQKMKTSSNTLDIAKLFSEVGLTFLPTCQRPLCPISSLIVLPLTSFLFLFIFLLVLWVIGSHFGFNLHLSY